MERFGNASHDGIQKLMDKSENKNTTKATATCVSYLGETQRRSA